MGYVYVILSFVISLVSFPVYIKLMKRYKLGQYIREEGPDLHNYKTGTPTAGGIIFIVVSAVIGLFIKVPIPLLLSLILFGLIGFIDDFASIRKKDALGLRAYQKLLLQIVFSIIIISFTEVRPIFGVEVSKFSYYFFWIFVITGASNAVNLTDGLDGLAGWIWVSSVLPMAFLFKDKFSLIVVSAVLCFLIFNTRPASIFMGDTGSLALGAFLATFAMYYDAEIQLVFSSSIFIIETLSVILQVSSYKMFRKRIFKMAPIHHHFELLGWKEEKIVGVFTAINLVISLSYIFARW